MKAKFPKCTVLACLYLPFIGVLFKNLLLQSFTIDSNPYNLDLASGFVRMLPFFVFQFAVTALIFAVGFLFRDRGRYYYAIITDVVLTVIAFIDIAYYRSYNVMPAAIMLPVAGSQGGRLTILEVLPSMFVWYDLLFLLDLVVWAVLFIIAWRRGWLDAYKPRRRPRNTVITAGASVLILVIVPLLNLFGLDGGLYRRMYVEADTVQQSLHFSYAGFHVSDLTQTALGTVTNARFTQNDETLQNEYFAWKNQESTSGAHKGEAAGKNLIVFQVESLENFVIGQTLNGREVTPTLNRLVRGGYYFPNVYEQVKCGNSSDCDFMLMTSLLPPNKSYVFGSYANNNYLSLPDLLHENGGYTSHYFHGASGGTWNYEDMLSDGLGVNHVNMNYVKDTMLNGYLDDSSFFAQTSEKLNDVSPDDPFYMHFVTCSSHLPFSVPADFDALPLSGELVGNRMGSYLQAINYVDYQIGMFLQELEQHGYLDNTLIMVTGDHGGVHKYYPHYVDNLQGTDTDSWYVTEEQYTLPLIFYSADMTAPEQKDVIGGQVDILPTLLHLMGVPEKQYDNILIGRNLFTTERSFAIRDDGKLHGYLSDEDYAIAKTMYYLSDLLIRSNRAY